MSKPHLHVIVTVRGTTGDHSYLLAQAYAAHMSLNDYVRQRLDLPPLGRPRQSKEKTASDASRIREYLREHPDASGLDVARALGVRRQAVYTVRANDRHSARVAARLASVRTTTQTENAS